LRLHYEWKKQCWVLRVDRQYTWKSFLKLPPPALR
jgi:hypothetical protein